MLNKICYHILKPLVGSIYPHQCLLSVTALAKRLESFTFKNSIRLYQLSLTEIEPSKYIVAAPVRSLTTVYNTKNVFFELARARPSLQKHGNESLDSRATWRWVEMEQAFSSSVNKVRYFFKSVVILRTSFIANIKVVKLRLKWRPILYPKYFLKFKVLYHHESFGWLQAVPRTAIQYDPQCLKWSYL